MLEPWREHIYEKEGYVSLLPVSWLMQFQGNRLRRSHEEMIAFSKEIESDGIREPLMLIVGQRTRIVRLGEGNHKLLAAKMAGMTLVPTRVTRYVQNDEGIFYDRMSKVPVRGYFPSDANPLDVFDWDVFTPYPEMAEVLVKYKPRSYIGLG